MTLQKEILEEAKKYGICDKFRKELETRELTIDQLCQMYHRGLDFCIEHNFPKRELIRKFNIADLHRNGIYYDYAGEITAGNFLVVNGQSNVDINVGFVSSIDLRDNTDARITVENGAFCYVSLRDNAQVMIASKGKNAKVFCSHFGGHIINKESFNDIHYK